MRKTLVLTLVVLTLMLIGIASPSPMQQPNLAKISVGNNRKCGVDGAAQPGSEKAKLNRLKNRFRLPSGGFNPITFNALLRLNQGHVTGTGRNRRIVGFPNSSNANNQRAVTLEGFVARVFVAGCEHGESCNCKTRDETICDTHIDVLPTEESDRRGGRNTFIVEVTPRSRILAAQGLLSSNVGNDWSTAILKSKLEGHRVKFSGFLYFDTDHAAEAFQSDPTNRIGGGNFRQTAWEVHPVLGIELIR